MSKALPYIFLTVLAIALGFMVYQMNDLAKLGNTTSVSHEIKK